MKKLKTLFAALLTILYCLLIFPIGLLLRGKREAQGYVCWDQARPEPRSMFMEINQVDTHMQGAAKASYFGVLYRLFSIFIANKKMILIPALIMIVLLGLILFFVSSNVMTAFVYTIF